jgi:hypothetical protein
MADERPPSDEDDAKKLDWAALSTSARRLLRVRLSGFDGSEIEDAAQDVCKRMVEFVDSDGAPERPEALLAFMARCVAATRITQRQRERRRHGGAGESSADEPSTDSAEQDIEDEIKATAAIVREYICFKCPTCTPIVEAIERGESLKDFVAREGRSYSQVVKAWSRCRQKLCEAMRKGHLRLNWPTPRKKMKRKPRDE